MDTILNKNMLIDKKPVYDVTLEKKIDDVQSNICSLTCIPNLDYLARAVLTKVYKEENIEPTTPLSDEIVKSWTVKVIAKNSTTNKDGILFEGTLNKFMTDIVASCANPTAALDFIAKYMETLMYTAPIQYACMHLRFKLDDKTAFTTAIAIKSEAIEATDADKEDFKEQSRKHLDSFINNLYGLVTPGQ